MIHCDDFRAKLSNSAIVKCLADASFFLDEYAYLSSLISSKQFLRAFSCHEAFFLSVSDYI